MAITNEELLGLGPGDVVRIIPLETLWEESVAWQDKVDAGTAIYNPFDDWIQAMDRFAGKTFVIKEITRIIVNEGAFGVAYLNDTDGYFWRSEFIDCVLFRDRDFDNIDDNSLEDFIFA